ncbi:hypothetical protein Leryth_007201 [Lithospermum erythrorhizon]|nr:hypothetical protein Leryth_007201 [Lithospermum erythrorhizon]
MIGVIELIGPEEEEDIKAAWGVKYLLGASEEDPPARGTLNLVLGSQCQIEAIPKARLVCAVPLLMGHDGKNFAVVSLRQIRSPCLGDKFSSMHGQKGVLGFLESQENFPFTKHGVVPDIVINPHAFPSRQTPGQLLEAALGKGIALGGSLKYATPFSTLTVEAITAQLHRLGFTRWGNEKVYNGRTGEMVESLVFMGPTFYQRLTHMSEDKVKFRNTGPVHPFTRQPVADTGSFYFQGSIRNGA